MDNERLAIVETKIENVSKGIERIEDTLNNHVKRESEMHKLYSGKWVEKVVLGVLIAVVVTALTVIPNSCSSTIAKGATYITQIK